MVSIEMVCEGCNVAMILTVVLGFLGVLCW